MKSELKLTDHSLIPGQKTIEVWYDGILIASVTGADGPGVRVISKYPSSARKVDPMIIQVDIHPDQPTLI